MKKYLAVFLLISTFISCEKDIDTIEENPSFWAPIISIEKGDQEATLSLFDPRAITSYYGDLPSDPDYFEIYVSTNINTLTFYEKVDVSTTSITISSLTNGTPYYFAVRSVKGNANRFTNTIMTVPSIIEEPEALFPAINFSMERVSFSQDRSYLTFISSDYPGEHFGQDMLYYMNTSTNSIKIVEQGFYNTSWSNSINTFAYINTTTIDNTIYPYNLKLFDAELSNETILYEIDFDKYYVFSPVFSPDDKLLSFLSSENNTEKYHYDIWTIDLSTEEKTKISNFGSVSFSTSGPLHWSSNDEHIYLDGSYQIDGSETNIYKVNVSTGGLSPVIESPWNDKTPSVSPDNSKVAFVSDRTGNDELWMYDQSTMKYRQVTGGLSYHFDSRYTNIEWFSNNELVISAYQNKIAKAVKIGVE